MMKKTVTLATLIKAKNDLELYIKVDQMARLKKLFDPNFDLSDINSKIESKEDQLILIKEAIQEANTNTKDKTGKSLNYSIYRLSKYNRLKADLLQIERKVNNAEWFSDGNDKLKKSLLSDIEELNTLIKKEEDKKNKASLTASKNKLRRSLSKISISSNSQSEKLKKELTEGLKSVESDIESLKDLLSQYNNSTSVEVDISDEFALIIK